MKNNFVLEKAEQLKQLFSQPHQYYFPEQER